MKYIIPLLLIIFMIAACSDPSDELNQPLQVEFHGDGFANPSSQNFHAFALKANNWDLDNCAQCHAADFSGGTTGQSCNTCHAGSRGPKQCNTCHGDFSDPARTAPPQDLADNTSSSFPGVGAHTKHMYEPGFALATECSACHEYNGYSSPGHIDGVPRSEIIFGDLAVRESNVDTVMTYNSDIGLVSPNPVYNPANYSCANTYCHGFFKNGNHDNVVSWTGGADQSKCGTCHGNPASGSPVPTGSHPQGISDCAICHPGVFSYDGANYTPVDASKHINGLLQLFNEEIEY